MRPSLTRQLPSRSLAILCCALVGALAACSDDSSTQDSGPSMDAPRVEASTSPEASIPLDAKQPREANGDKAVTDQTIKPDAPQASCSTSLDLKPLTLDSGYCVVYRFKVTGSPVALRTASDRAWTYGGDGKPFKGEVLEWKVNATGSAATSSSYSAYTRSSTSTLYPSQYLAMTSTGHPAVGYTDGDTFDGEIIWGKGASPLEIPHAKGNYDAVLLDDQTLLVNGNGAAAAQDGQGIYLIEKSGAPRRLIKDLGDLSGYIALGTDVLFASGYSGTNKIYAFALSKVRAAITGKQVLSATTDGTLVASDRILDASALGNDLLLVRAAPFYVFESVSVIPITVSGTTITAGTKKDLVTTSSGATTAVTAAVGQGTGFGLLLHTKSPASDELVLVQKR